MKCEGYRRYGGAFTLGPVKWEQCTNEATVNITFVQDGKEHTLPGCLECWQECIENKLDIKSVNPIIEE